MNSVNTTFDQPDSAMKRARDSKSARVVFLIAYLINVLIFVFRINPDFEFGDLTVHLPFLITFAFGAVLYPKASTRAWAIALMVAASAAYFTTWLVLMGLMPTIND